MNVLILGGTTEATALARHLEGHPVLRATMSLAGRTVRPVLSGLPTRIGGFGGVDGLAAYLREVGIDALVDATHPFARVMSDNAVQASALIGVPLARLVRPDWTPDPGDTWIRVADLHAAVQALKGLGHRVLVTTGRKNLAPFEALPDKHYVIRTIDPPDPPPTLPNAVLIQTRGPFDRDSEAALMDRHAIDVLVTKASGGAATQAKLAAARDRGIPVVMIDRPEATRADAIHCDPAQTVAWLNDLAERHRDISPAPPDRASAAPPACGTYRGV